MSAVWITEVRFHPDVEAKVERKHGLSAESVRRAVLYQTDLPCRWHDDPVYGRRLLIETSHPDDRRRLRVILAPVDEREGIWVCRTAMVR